MHKRNKLILVSVGALATLWLLLVDRNGMNIILTHHQLDGSYAKEDQYLTIHAANQSQTRSSKVFRSTLRTELLSNRKSPVSYHNDTSFASKSTDISELISEKHAIRRLDSLKELQFARSLLKHKLILEFVNGTDFQEVQSSSHSSSLQFLDRYEDMSVFGNIGENRNYSFQLGDTIQTNEARHFLIVSSYRSGSSFLGDLLNHYRGTFYSFEPLLYNENKIRKSKLSEAEKYTEYIDMIIQVFKCTPEKGYLQHAHEKRYIFQHNFRFWNVCENVANRTSTKKDVRPCYSPDIYSKMCQMLPIRLIKTVRLPVNETRRLFLDQQLKESLKIIFLIRDPRGIMHSRSSMEWCTRKDCKDPFTVCKNLESDILAAYQLKKEFPGNIYLVRYEDLCMKPFVTTDKLLKFLDLAPSKLVERFLEQHTKSLRNATLSALPLAGVQSISNQELSSQQFLQIPYRTFRDSKATVFKWKQNMKKKEIVKVQSACKRSMSMMGYNYMTNILVNKNDSSFPLIVKAPDEIWSPEI